jgi:pimeloyl-ACP methyl ester carboxylesterase
VSTEARPSLVLLPGLLCDQRLFAAQVAALAGLAEVWVADLTRHDSLAAMADEVLRDAPAGPFAVAGLSMGGYLAFEILRRAPERAARLAVLDTSARADTEEQSARRRGLLELAAKGQFKGVTPRLLPMLIHPDRMADDELKETVVAMADAVGQEAFARQQRAIMGRPDSRGDLAGVRCPTLVLCGREDALTPPALAEEIAAGIPGADLVVLGRCGHLSALERPAAVTAALRGWLER